MKKRLFTGLLAALLLAGALTSVFLLSGAEEGTAAFDPDTYSYEDLYVKEGLISWFDASDAKAGDTVTDTLPNKVAGGQDFVLKKAKDSYTVSWAYGDGYLQTGTGGMIYMENALTLPGANETSSFTLEYIFSALDEAPQGITPASGSFANNYIPYRQEQETYNIGGWALYTSYISPANRQILQELAEAYQAAQKDTALQASYTFMPNESDLATYDTDGSGYLNFTETTALLQEKASAYYPLTLDYSKCMQSGIGKSIFYLNDVWKSDCDWKDESREILRMTPGTIRKLSLLMSITGTDDGNFSTASELYRDASSLLKASATGAAAKESIMLSTNLSSRVYAIRLYDRVLTEAEVMQNHFADVCQFYQLDPSFYLDASDINRELYDHALKSIVVGTTTPEEVTSILSAALNKMADTSKNEYTDLFVQDGLLLMLNPISIKQEHAAGDEVAAITTLDGRSFATSGITWTAEGGFNVPSGVALDLNEVLPTLGNYSVQIFFAHSDKPTGQNTGTNAYPHMLIGPASYSMSYAPPDVNTVPGGVTKTWLYMVDGTTGVQNWKRDFDTSWGASKQPVLFAKPYGSVMEFTNNFSISERGSVTVSVIQNGTTVSSASSVYGSYINGRLKFGPYFNEDLYTILVYDHNLTSEEMLQNHFALLMAYHKVDMSSFVNIVDDNTRARLYKEFENVRPEQTTREYLQSTVDNFALTGGTLGIIKAEDYIGFSGMQARIKDYASARGLFYIDRARFEQLEQLNAQIEYGVLMAKADDVSQADDLVLTFDRATGEYVTANTGIQITPVYRRGEFFQEAHVSKTADRLYFAATIDAVWPEDFDRAEALNCEYYMRGYIAVDLHGTRFVFYADSSSVLFGDSVSINEAAKYFLYSGFADSAILSTLCGEQATAGALAALDTFKAAQNAYLSADDAAKLIQSAFDGATLSNVSYKEHATGITTTMSMADAMTKGPLATSYKAQTLLYAQVGLDKYELAQENVATARAFAEQIGAIAYDAAVKAGADKIAATAISLDAADKILLQIADVETYLQQSTELKDGLTAIVDSFSNDMSSNKLQAAIGAKSRLFINTRSLAYFTIITDTAHMESAQALQKLLLKRFATGVGIYNIDNPYIGSHFDYSKQYGIYVGITADELPLSESAVYSLYGEDKAIYLEGSTVEATEAAVAALVKELADGTGRVQVTLDRGDNAYLGRTYTPLISFNHQDTYPAVTISSYDANGVWEVFKQKVSQLPKEVSVIESKLPQSYAGSIKLEYYVATNGNDENAGTVDAPFATVQRALEAVAYEGGGVIWIRGGTYSISDPISLNAAHSGTVASPLFISAYPGEQVTFTAAKQIDAGALQTIDQAIASGTIDASVKNRLNTFVADNHKHVYVIKLDPQSYVFDTTGRSSIFVGESEFHTARFPNAGQNDSANGIEDGRVNFSNTADGTNNDIKKVGHVSTTTSGLYKDHNSEVGGWELYYENAPYASRIDRYDLSDTQLYTYAAVYQEWHRAHYALTLLTDSTNGRPYMQSATNCVWGAMESAGNNMYFYNIIEELDAAQEYYLDTGRALLYIWSETAISADTEILYNASSVKLVQIDSASNVVINGIAFTKTKGVAVSAVRCRNVIVQDCHISYATGGGVSITEGVQCGVLGCEINNTAENVVSGSTNEMKSTHNFVQNCYIHGETESMEPSLSVGGFGDIISHNRFYEVGVYFGSAYECVVEYNEFDKDGQYTHDGGPIYLASPTGKRNNHIRYNLCHNLNVSRYGIYLDDLSSGNYVYGNIIEYAEENSGSGKCVNIHGGNMNVVYNNIGLRAGMAGFKDDTNYYVQKIDGQSTNAGGFSNRWESMSSGLANTYSSLVSRWGLEAFRGRFPLYEWYVSKVVQHVEERSERDNWNPYDKFSGVDDLELFLREPSFNVYVNNVMYACAKGWIVYTVGMKTALFENNLQYDDGKDIGFTDPATDNYTFKADSVIYQLIPDFEEISFDRIGLLDD